MNIETPYVPTALLLAEAVPFTNFDAELSVEYDMIASKTLGRKYYIVEESFRYYLSEKQPDVWGYVPAGFLTDGASVPRPFWWCIPPWGPYGQAAVLHDILCETKTMFKNDIPYQITRKEADYIFRDAMKAAQVNVVLRNVMFLAVRLWGKYGWSPSKQSTARKRALEAKYMRDYGTYREPTAILKQVTYALAHSGASEQPAI